MRWSDGRTHNAIASVGFDAVVDFATASANIAVANIAALVGCSDEPAQTAWNLELTYTSRSCAMHSDVKLWIMDQDGGFAPP